jgi:hypothetical protein
MMRGVFTSVPDMKRKLMRYIRQYNEQAKPVRWNTSNLATHYSRFNRCSPLVLPRMPARLSTRLFAMPFAPELTLGEPFPGPSIGAESTPGRDRIKVDVM